MVGEAVSNVAQLSLLDVLLDRVEGLFLANLHFGVGPARNLDDHIEDTIVGVSEEGDVVEWRDNGAILLDVDAMFYDTPMSSGDSR